MNKEKIKIINAWIFLILLIALFIYVNHIKFFRVEINESTLEKTPVENSTAEAIQLALTNIVDNFNNNSLIEQYKNEGIELNASVNNYSLYISHTKDITTTYEFNYSNLLLSINITNNEENITKFNKVYEILIKAIQERIKNEFDTTNIISKHLNENINYDGLTKEINENIITYKIDITKRLIEEGSEENGNSTH